MRAPSSSSVYPARLPAFSALFLSEGTEVIIRMPGFPLMRMEKPEYCRILSSSESRVTIDLPAASLVTRQTVRLVG